jgi:hypothetical protein
MTSVVQGIVGRSASMNRMPSIELDIEPRSTSDEPSRVAVPRWGT